MKTLATLYTMHAPDPKHTEEVVREMQSLGSPTLRVVDCGDYYFAIEGVHRIAAAEKLGIEIELNVLEQDDLVRGDSLDWQYYLQPGEEYTAGELVAEVHSPSNGVYLRGEDGVFKEYMPRTKPRGHSPS